MIALYTTLNIDAKLSSKAIKVDFPRDQSDYMKVHVQTNIQIRTVKNRCF